MTTTTAHAYRSLKEGAKPRQVAVARECQKCSGAGGFRGWPGYTCWRCGGVGTDPTPAKVWAYPPQWTDEQCETHEAARIAKTAERRTIREAARAAKAAAKSAEWLSANPETELVLATVTDVDNFLASMRSALARSGSLTERQAAATAAYPEREAKRAERHAAEQAKREAAEPVPTGSETIVGIVLSTKWVDGHYGSSLKMLVEEERGWKVWGSVPSAIDPESGDRVTFIANVAPSDDDPLFGFFKRPRKATCEIAAENAAAR